MDEWRDLTPFTWEGFEAWLRAQRPDHHVGRCCSQDDCPLARYISLLNGGERAWVSGAAYGARWHRPGVTRLDERGRLFTTIVDRLACLGASFRSRPVTAAECLDVVEGRRGLPVWSAV